MTSAQSSESSRQPYKERWTETAAEALRALPKEVQTSAFRRLATVCQDPRAAVGVAALKGQLRGKFRIRAGKDYRVVFIFDHSAREVIVIAIAHRSDVYG